MGNHSFKDFVKSKAMAALQMCVDEEEALPELVSLRQIIDNPITLYCLRMFMTSNLRVFIQKHRLVVSTCLVFRLLFKSGSLHRGIVQLCVCIAHLFLHDEQLEPLSDSRF